MQEYIENANCKINLFLEIGKRLKNGYHTMDMVMQSLSLSDEISLKKAKNGGITISSSVPFPNQEETIAYRCAKGFFDFYNIKDRSVNITLSSKIPFMSGLGGGSADGGAVLRGLAKLYGVPLSLEELSLIGKKIGADIPFCLRGGLCKVGGFGEKLEPLSEENALSYGVLLAKPLEFSVSTGLAFSALDEKADREPRSSEEIISAIKKKDLKNMARLCYNGFFEHGKENYSPSSKLIDAIKKTSALGSAMTGSGSAVFGIYPSKAHAQLAIKELETLSYLPKSLYFSAQTTLPALK